MYSIALQFFDTTPKQDIASVTDQKTKTRTPQTIRCSGCGHVITTVAESIRVQQHHEHTCMNPAGFEFTFGCFRSAPGAHAQGPAVYEHTWFAGYSWQLLFCLSCNRHLGWLFRNHDVFFALILNRLKYD